MTLHFSGFVLQQRPVPESLRRLEIYDQFDGAVLFSSTFYIASLEIAKEFKGSPATYSLKELGEVAVEDGSKFPDGSIPFMVNTGIGYYALAPTGVILRWDVEFEEHKEYLHAVEQIIEAFPGWLGGQGTASADRHAKAWRN